MKALFLATALLITATAHADLFKLRCQFDSASTYQQTETSVVLNCDNGWGSVQLLGENNSPCKSSDILNKFFAGAIAGEKVNLVAETGSYSSLDGIQSRVDVSMAKRAGSKDVLEAPTLVYHGKPRKCNNTQVQIFRK